MTINHKLSEMIRDTAYYITDNSNNMDELVEYLADMISHIIMYLHPTAKEVLIERIRMLLNEIED